MSYLFSNTLRVTEDIHPKYPSLCGRKYWNMRSWVGSVNPCHMSVMCAVLLCMMMTFTVQAFTSSAMVSFSSSTRSLRTIQPKFAHSEKSHVSLNLLRHVNRNIVRLKTSSLNVNKNLSADSNKNNSSLNIRERLLKLSNIASLLCVVDCTVLPFVTVLLPLLGLGAATSYSGFSNTMHSIGHQMALYFVLPIGGFTMIMNYLNNQKKRLLVMSSLGMGLIYLANAGHHSPILAFLPHKLAHDITCGTVLHRVVNLVGCAFLLGSNYLGKNKSTGCIAQKQGCQHDHHHGE